MPEEQNESRKTLKNVYKTVAGGKSVAACIRECRENYGPTSANYDPVKEAECMRGCQTKA